MENIFKIKNSDGKEFYPITTQSVVNVKLNDLDNSFDAFENLIIYDGSGWIEGQFYAANAQLDTYLTFSQSPPFSVVGENYIYFYKIVDDKFVSYTVNQLYVAFYTADGVVSYTIYGGDRVNDNQISLTANDYYVSVPVNEEGRANESTFVSFNGDLDGKHIGLEYSLRQANEELIKYAKDLHKISTTATNNQWDGLKWYAYGTSLTSTSYGKYATPLSNLSGLILTNKGIGGGGITNLGGYSTGQVKAAVMNTTDGKLEADLISLEVGANDSIDESLIGTEYDFDDTTYAGCLNQCIQYLQKNTNAQIIVMSSGVSTTNPLDGGIDFKIREMNEKCARINRCYYISEANGLGWARAGQVDNKDYIYDNIHNTDLGGEIWANSIWFQLQNIPTWK